MKGTKQQQKEYRATSIRFLGKRLLRNSSLILLATIFTVGCAKELPYDTKDQDRSSLKADQSKALISTSDLYLYVASNNNSSRTTNSIFPGYMGDSKIVKFRFSENALEVIEYDPEDPFQVNPANQKPVLSVPIKHVDYRCAPDAEGKCTNKEEVDESTKWSAKKLFQLEPKMSVQEITAMPLEIRSLFLNCFKEMNSEITSAKFENDAVNIGVERVYRGSVDGACADKFTGLSDLNFRVEYNYSFAKLSTVTTPNYKTFNYTRKEESTFGFFDNDTLKLDSDNVGRVPGERKRLHRWAPGRTVDYYLSANFNKPEYAKVRQATVQSIESINRSLEAAGANLKIALKDATPDLNLGDIRNSSIVLVEDPLNYGILGYGPTAFNPVTGEIVQGRTVMYIGVIKTGLARSYDEVLIDFLQSKNKPSDEKEKMPPSGKVLPLKGVINRSLSLSEGPKVLSVQNKSKNLLADKLASQANSLMVGHNHPHGMTDKTAQIVQAVREKKSLKYSHIDLSNENREAALKQIKSLNCFYDINDININDLLEDEIKKLIQELGERPWAQLNEAERNRAIDTLLPFVWIPTLIHEVGHNLGLRHNFAGSEDEANFYTEAELKQLGMRRPFSYSSVMDYGYRTTNELRLMGKYDIAALRFGYAEKVEKEDGALISVEEARADSSIKLKNYEFCTDEHADVNPNCNRFDEGTSLVEMSKHWVRMYAEAYPRRNLRNELSDFSLMDDPSYLDRLNRVFDNLRSNFERYESVKLRFSLKDDAKEWASIPFLKDLKESTLIAGKFFLEVLKTPDVMCAVARKQQPGNIIALAPIRQLSPVAISCSEENLVNPNFVVVGEAGKSFQSRKSSTNKNPYMDQIDVRGIWLDKMVAMKSLVGRLTGNTIYDQYTSNFLDIPEIRKEIESTLGELILDEMVTTVSIVTINGQILNTEAAVQFYNDEIGQNSHRIPAHVSAGMNRRFEIPKEGIDFQTKIVEILKSSLPSAEQESDVTSMLNSVHAQVGLANGEAKRDFVQVDVGLKNIYVHTKSTLAVAVANRLELVRTLGKINPDRLKQILALVKESKPLPANPSKDDTFAYGLGEETLTIYLAGGFHEPSYYEKLLLAMIQN